MRHALSQHAQIARVRFEYAHQGTILLDEICEFKIELQPKLLRALEERKFYPVGSDRERRMNVRVLAATNRDPQACIAGGTLRADLYYRLATVLVKVPPLRVRRDDIVPLAEHFCGHFRSEFRRPRLALTAAARETLLAYQWPGNVRELKNVVERAVVLAAGDFIDQHDLMLSKLPTSGDTTDLLVTNQEFKPISLAEMERRHILATLKATNWNKSQTAQILGIERSTLDRKIRRYGLKRELRLPR